MSNIEKIQSLLRSAETLCGFHKLYSDKYSPNSNCDKKGFGFGKANRFSSFDVKTSFDNWAGYFGNSSCSTIMHVDRALAADFVVKAMNVHQREIFATAAKLMRDEARKLRGDAQTEIDRLQALLDSTEQAKVSEAAE